jgi:hypothetical protein
MITRFSCPCHSGSRPGWQWQPKRAILPNRRVDPPLMGRVSSMWVTHQAWFAGEMTPAPMMAQIPATA